MIFFSHRFIPETSITLQQSDKDNEIKGNAYHVWCPLFGLGIPRILSLILTVTF